MLLSRADAAKHLGISIATLERRVKRGELTPVYGEPTSNFGRRSVWFEFPELDAPAQVTLEEHTPASPEPAPVLPLPNVEQRFESDLHFAHKYLQGEVCDSFGNSISASSAHRTALGPEPPIEHRPVPTTTSHMDQRLLPNMNQPSADSLEHPLNKNFKGLESPPKPVHPNYTRQQLLNVILRDVREGWSR